MKSRCSDSNVPCWDYYGGRGVKVCKSWESYEEFLADMGRRPSSAHSLDRIDSNGDYIPENCRWATKTEQTRNRRNNRFLSHNGETKSVAEWCEQLGLSTGTVDARLFRGWSDSEALKRPMRHVGNQWEDV